MASRRKLAPIPQALQKLQNDLDSSQALNDTARIAKVDVVMRLVPFHTVTSNESAPEGIKGSGVLPLRRIESTAAEQRCIYVDPDRQTVVAIDPQAPASAPVSQRQTRQRLDLGLHAETSNTSACRTLSQVAIHQWLFQGFNANLVAFGRASTGKSTLLLGDASHGTGNVAVDGGFDDMFSHCVSAVFQAQASKQEYMCALCAWEIKQDGIIDLLEPKVSERTLPLRPPSVPAGAAVPAASVLCTSAADAHRVLLTAKQRSASWTAAPHTDNAQIPTAAESHVCVALRLLHVPSGRCSVLHLVDIGGWAAESRLSSAHEAPPRGACGDPSTARTIRRQCYHLRQWLRNLGAAARKASKGVQGGSPSTAPGASLRMQALSVSGAKESPLNKMLSWLLLGNAKTFLVGCASCFVGDYFDTLGTLRCLAAAGSVQVPIVPISGVSAASMGPLLSVAEVLPDSLASSTRHPLASMLQPSQGGGAQQSEGGGAQPSQSGDVLHGTHAQTGPQQQTHSWPEGTQAAKEGDSSRAGDATCAAASPPTSHPIKCGLTSTRSHTNATHHVAASLPASTAAAASAAAPPPVTAAAATAAATPPVTAAQQWVARPLSPNLFSAAASSAEHPSSAAPVCSSTVPSSTAVSAQATREQARRADDAVARLLAADTQAEHMSGPSLLDMAAQMNALVGDLLGGHSQQSSVAHPPVSTSDAPPLHPSSHLQRQQHPHHHRPPHNHHQWTSSTQHSLHPQANAAHTTATAEVTHSATSSAGASDTVSLYSLGGGNAAGGGGQAYRSRSLSLSGASVSSSVTQHTADRHASHAAMQRLSNPPSRAATPPPQEGTGDIPTPFDGVSSFRPLPQSSAYAPPPTAHDQGQCAGPVHVPTAPASPGDSDLDDPAFHEALLEGGLHDSLQAALGSVQQPHTTQQLPSSVARPPQSATAAPPQSHAHALSEASHAAESALEALARQSLGDDSKSTDSLEATYSEWEGGGWRC